MCLALLYQALACLNCCSVISMSIILNSFTLLLDLVLIGFILSSGNNVAQCVVFSKSIKRPRGNKL